MNKAQGCRGAGRNAPPLLPVSPGHPVTSSVALPTPVCSRAVMDTARLSTGKQLRAVEGAPTAGTGWKPSLGCSELRVQLLPRAPALPVLQQQRAGVPTFQDPRKPSSIPG